MTLHVKDGGTFKTATPHVKTGGIWKAVQAGYVKDAGVWKQFFTALNAAINDATISTYTTSGGAFGTFSVNSTGDYGKSSSTSPSYSSLGTWLLSGTAADFEIYASFSGPGGTVSGSATGVWLAMSTSRSWTVNVANNVASTKTLNLQIRRVSDQVVIDTAAISFDVSSGTPV